MLPTRSYSIYLSQSVKTEMSTTRHNWKPIVLSSITNVSNLLKSRLPFSRLYCGSYFPQTHHESIDNSKLPPNTIQSYLNYSTKWIVRKGTLYYLTGTTRQIISIRSNTSCSSITVLDFLFAWFFFFLNFSSSRTYSHYFHFLKATTIGTFWNAKYLPPSWH